MPVQIGAKPDSGFDDPIGMLKDCHRRILLFLGILCKVIRQAQGRALDEDESRAIQAALRYFRESEPNHNHDEEDSLFPRLECRQIGTVAKTVRRLKSEHQENGKLHLDAGILYSKWMSEGRLSAEEEARLLAITEKLQAIYKEHIPLEEEVVFPCAAQFIERPELDAMGAEFAARRGRQVDGRSVGLPQL